MGISKWERERERARMQINTLGQFSIRCYDAILTEEARRSQKLWDLFTYFLRHRNHLISPQTIAEQLWPDNENADPRAAIQDLIYRMRKLFRQGKSAGEELIHIEFSQGSYRFQLGENCWCDVDEFMACTEEAARLGDEEPSRAIEAFLRSVDLYRGHYLPGWSHRPWLVPLRQYYRRVYVGNIVRLIELLRAQARYADIVEVCERAFMIESLVEAEDLHYGFMEALVKAGRPNDALEHYEFLSRLMKMQLDVQPGDSLQQLCRLIRSDREVIESEEVDHSLRSISDKLMRAEEVEGALLCDREVFRSLYRLEARRSERRDDHCFLGVITVADAAGEIPDRPVLDRVVPQLGEVLVANLRKGDAVTQWNEAQFLILLSCFQRNDARVCLSRIERGFYLRCAERNMQVQSEFGVVADEVEQDSPVG